MADPLINEYVAKWIQAHPDEVEKWKEANPGASDPKPENMVGPFLENYAAASPGTWLSVQSQTTPDGKTVKVIQHITSGSDIQANFFEMWLQENPTVDLEKVPADMVTTSGSGLDPHITLDNARWQLDHRIADAWVKKYPNLRKEDVVAEIKKILKEKQKAPLGGLAGVPLINVLVVNIELDARMQQLQTAK